MTPVSGTKLDIKVNKRAWFGRAARRVVVLTAMMAGVVSGSQAENTVSGLVDPTRPSYISPSADTKMTQYSGPVLQSTFVSESRRRAVISGKTYKVGDKFGGAMIADIHPYEVVLKQAGRERRLRLLPKLAKQGYVVKTPANSREGENDN
jgi:MSHA biogenesis protein MshK